MGPNMTDQDLLITLLLNGIRLKHKFILSPFLLTQMICEVGFILKMSK